MTKDVKKIKFSLNLYYKFHVGFIYIVKPRLKSHRELKFGDLQNATYRNLNAPKPLFQFQMMI